MALKRYADAVWAGDLQSGKGSLSTPQSGLFEGQNYSFKTRFGEEMQVFKIQTVRAVVRSRIQQRVGTFSEHRHPTCEVVIGNRTRITEDCAVVVND